MRHKMAGRRLNRRTGQLKALLRNMSIALIRDERIMTTSEKAKTIRPFVEKLITRAREKNLNNVRYVRRILGNAEPLNRPAARTGKPFGGKQALWKLFNDIGPRNATRPGGYTRIIALPMRRQGDAASRVIFELVEKTTSPSPSGAAKGG